VQHVKAQARIKASQLCKFVYLKIQEIQRERDQPMLSVHPSDIKLYFFGKNGKRWYFEGGQRICHILQERYWSVEKCFLPVNPKDVIPRVDREDSYVGQGISNLGGMSLDYQELVRNYKPRDLTEMEHIYVILKSDYDQ
jgi:hypothetical protein